MYGPSPLSTYLSRLELTCLIQCLIQKDVLKAVNEQWFADLLGEGRLRAGTSNGTSNGTSGTRRRAGAGGVAVGELGGARLLFLV